MGRSRQEQYAQLSRAVQNRPVQSGAVRSRGEQSGVVERLCRAVSPLRARGVRGVHRGSVACLWSSQTQRGVRVACAWRAQRQRYMPVAFEDAA